MRKFLTMLAVFALSGCASPLSAADLDMKVSVSSPEIRLNIANGLQQEADISYSIANNSNAAISADSYSIVIGAVRRNEAATIILKDVSGEILPGGILEGTYAHKFVKVVGAEGDQKISLVIYERKGEAMREIKTVSVPVKVVYED